MKYKLLAVKCSDRAINIGDYIQALASYQFLPSFDGFIEREKLKDYNEEQCQMIMNGWYMHDPSQWPPSKKIVPLFVAFHINSTVKSIFSSDSSIEYLKQYEPIGCRDYYTQKFLSDCGINSYFSGCMTLTLGRDYHTECKNGKIYFVDPYFPYQIDFLSIIENSIYSLFHIIPIWKIARKFPSNRHGWIKIIKVGAFFRIYKKKFCTKLLQDAGYVTQQAYSYNSRFVSNEDLLAEAQRLVRIYAQAKLVVTSRIHCALPCLGVETPVIFIENTHSSLKSKCRMEGLRDLFNIITLDNRAFEDKFEVDNVISESTLIRNKETWKQYSVELTNRCLAFFHQNK